MKRGLVVLDPAEVPPSELEGRVAALQAVLRARGLAGALVYGDVYRSGDVTYLSNICLYWNEGILAVPAEGGAAFVTKLSRRVQTWMRATSNLTDLRSGPRLARLVAEYAAGLPDGPVGLVERAWWPAPLLGELANELEGRALVDLGPVVRRAREAPSAAELALVRAGAALTAASVAGALDGGLTPEERAGRAELAARSGGVEDVVVRSHPAGPDAATLEVVGEYRGYWTSAARVLVQGAPSWAAAVEDAYRAAASALRPGVSPSRVRAAAAEALSGLGRPWHLDVRHHVDLETNGGYRLADERDEEVGDGSVVAVRLGVDLAPGIPAVASDTYLVGAEGPTRLTSGLGEAATHAVA